MNELSSRTNLRKSYRLKGLVSYRYESWKDNKISDPHSNFRIFHKLIQEAVTQKFRRLNWNSFHRGCCGFFYRFAISIVSSVILTLNMVVYWIFEHMFQTLVWTFFLVSRFDLKTSTWKLKFEEMTERKYGTHVSSVSRSRSTFGFCTLDGNGTRSQNNNTNSRNCHLLIPNAWNRWAPREVTIWSTRCFEHVR